MKKPPTLTPPPQSPCLLTTVVIVTNGNSTLPLPNLVIGSVPRLFLSGFFLSPELFLLQELEQPLFPDSLFLFHGTRAKA
ncbi:putative inactive receptor-like protein kinase [Sesbania bispinosa]|nr:putative inactive receptor-like protein kinase [Sesbania bispinosa]